jgi:hypothetical protein
MKSTVKWAVAASVLLLAVIGWQRRWWSGEPATGGRTVTEWLDSMALFEEWRRRDETGQNSFRYITDPSAVTNDAALRALVGLGPRAVPVLTQRLVEPPRLPFRERASNWLRWRWTQVRTLNQPPLGPPGEPTFFSSREEARKMASGLALLAIGREDGGGMTVTLEALAGASKNWQDKRFPGQFFPPAFFLPTALPGLPDRRTEMAGEVFDLLSHTNAPTRRLAADSAGYFVDELRAWKPTLVRLADEDPETMIRISALWSLATRLKDDHEVLALCVRTAAETNHPPLLRSYAVSGVFFAGGASAVEHLPLLEAIQAQAARLADTAPGQAGQNYRHLRDSARDAIENINRQPAQ